MSEVSIRKFDYIDAIRCFAILGVVLVHSSQWISPKSELLSNIATQGAQGVQLFFVASSLTMFLSMEARKNQEKRPLVKFFIRRFFRIAPLFYLAIIIYVLHDGMVPRYWAPNGIQWWYIPLTAFFLHGWLPETANSVVPGGWSIAVEMTFYLFVPYLFQKLNNLKSTLTALFGSLILRTLSIIVVVLALRPYYSANQQYLVGSFSYFWFFSQAPVFILGILLYHLIKKYPNKDRVMGTILVFVSFFLFAAFLKTSIFSVFLPSHILYGAAFLLFSLSLHFWPHALLINGITTFIGKLSFSIYLVHFIVVDTMTSLFIKYHITLGGTLGFVSAYLLILIISISISYITHRFIETPGISLGKWIIKKLS